MSRTGPISEDRETAVLGKKAPTAAAKEDQKVVNAARRAGVAVKTVKKYDCVPSELKKAITQARMNKKLTPAQTINEKPQVIQDYESGKAIPNWI